MTDPATTTNNNSNSRAHKFGKVAVLTGTDSAEREVSLRSGRAVLAGLLKAGVDAHLIDISDYPLSNLRADGFDRAFVMAPGGSGGNGELQSVLQYLRIPFTGSRVLASAITSDKWRCKMLWRGFGLPVAPGVCIQRPTGTKSPLNPSVIAQIDAIGYPVFVKPCSNGSSFGISRVRDAAKLPAAIDSAFKFDSAILVEKFLRGHEYTVGIVGNRVLPSVRVIPANEFYTCADKEVGNKTQFICPSGLNAKEEARIQQVALDAWKAVGGRDVGRFDLIADDDDFYLLEVNSSCALSEISPMQLAAKHVGWDASDLMLRILESAEEFEL